MRHQTEFQARLHCIGWKHKILEACRCINFINPAVNSSFIKLEKEARQMDLVVNGNKAKVPLSSNEHLSELTSWLASQIFKLVENFVHLGVRRTLTNSGYFVLSLQLKSKVRPRRTKNKLHIPTLLDNGLMRRHWRSAVNNETATTPAKSPGWMTAFHLW